MGDGLNTAAIRYQKPDTVYLFGGSQLLVRIAYALTLRGQKIRVFTCPDQEKERTKSSAGYATLGAELRRHGIDYDSVEELPELPIGPTDIGLGLGERWIFTEKQRNMFSGDRLIDVMAIPLPQYRGRAHQTHMILRGDRDQGICLQLVTPNTVQGEFDDGPIISAHRFKVPDSATTPQDYMDAIDTEGLNFLLKFFLEIEAGSPFFPEIINESNSMFLPGLRTAFHGWINWAWSGKDILSFIHAFSDPYPGALTTLNSDIVHLKDAELVKDGFRFHPFHSGIITRKSDDGLYIATTAGHILVRKVLIGEHDVTQGCKLGDRFTSDPVKLDTAIRYKPEFSPYGYGL